MASFSRLSFEDEVRSLNIAKIQSYNTGKNVPFVSHSGLDPIQIDLFLYPSIPFLVLNQYHFAVQADRLIYGTIRTYLKKGSEYRLGITRGQQRGRTERT